MVASQMSAAWYDTTNVEIKASNAGSEKQHRGYLLKASSSVVKFSGFMVVYSESRDEDERGESLAEYDFGATPALGPSHFDARLFVSST